MAGWDRNADWNHDVLARIVALLLSLANLADLAAGAPFLRRRRVLGIVNWGETEARALLIGMASGTAVSADALEPSGDTMELAVRLRALALMLCLLLTRRFRPPRATGPRADLCGAAEMAGCRAVQPAFDTS